MSALSIQPTYPIFTDIDGQPLEAGYVWIGTANLDPQTNPITVYWDAALTILAPQPIRTLAGYPSNNGTPARLYVNSDYSIRVMNKNGSTVYSAPAATERFSSGVVDMDASNITYTQGAVGTVQLTAQDKFEQLVNVEDFGAIGDAVTDDYQALQNALNWSKANSRPVYLNEKRYYTSNTLDVGGAIIRSISGIPGGADPRFLRKPDGTYVFGSPDFTWFYNTGHPTYTWADMIADTSFGCAIISNFNGPILFVDNGFKFNVNGFAVIGYQNLTSQDGLATAIPDVYRSTSQSINNIVVISCGRHGINLERGFEVSEITNVTCFANNGHGLRTGQVNGIDCATEYLVFRDCGFSVNRLDGVFFSHVRKAVKFENCNFNENGQYNSPGGIDPVLGYNRNVPLTTAAMVAGVKVNDGSLDLGAGFLFGISMIDCYGELVAVGLHLRCRNGAGVCRDVRLQNNIWLRATQVGTSVAGGGQNGTACYFDVTYVANWVLTGNYPQALQNYVFATVPIGDFTSRMFFVDEAMPLSTSAEREFAKLSYPAPIQSSYYIRSEGRTYGDQTLARSIGGLAAPGNVTTSVVSTDYTVAIGNNASNFVAVYSLTASFQSSASDNFGGYLLFVTKVPSAAYMMTTIAMSSTDGFTGAPTINASTGEITIPAAAFYRFTIQRIDNVLTNTTP
jgi:hypothetical protein